MWASPISFAFIKLKPDLHKIYVRHYGQGENYSKFSKKNTQYIFHTW